MSTIDEIKRKLDEVSRKVSDASQLMADIADDLARAVEDNFLRGGRPKWLALSKVTKAIRKTQGKWPGQILVRTGILKNSWTTAHTKDEARVGTNIKYAKVLNDGATRGALFSGDVQVKAHTRKLKKRDRVWRRKKYASGVQFVKAHTRHIESPWGDIPARPMDTLAEADRKRILSTINEYLKKLTR